MPQEPFDATKLSQNLGFSDALLFLIAHAASGLQELLDAHGNMEPIQVVFGTLLCRI